MQHERSSDGVNPILPEDRDTKKLFKNFLSVISKEDRARKKASKEAGLMPPLSATVTATYNDWEKIASTYAVWCDDAFLNEKTHTPTPQQASVLHMAHERTKYEYSIAQDILLTEDMANMSPVPEYKLIHGLPGSGKSLVFKCVRSYLEIVWEHAHGILFRAHSSFEQCGRQPRWSDPTQILACSLTEQLRCIFEH